MGNLHHFAALIALAVAASPAALKAEVQYQQARRLVRTDRAGLPPVIFLGSEAVLARDNLVGTWQVTYLECKGDPQPDLALDLQMRFSRGKLELMQRGRATIVVSYNLDITASPPGITWVLPRSSYIPTQRGLLWWIQSGIYWLEDDTLMICLGAVNGQPAKEFLTQPIDGQTLFILERVKPPVPAPSPQPTPESKP